MYLSICFSVGGAVCAGYRTFGKYRITRESMSLSVYNLTSLPIFAVCFLPLLPHLAFPTLMESSPLESEMKQVFLA